MKVIGGEGSMTLLSSEVEMFLHVLPFHSSADCRTHFGNWNSFTKLIFYGDNTYHEMVFYQEKQITYDIIFRLPSLAFYVCIIKLSK